MKYSFRNCLLIFILLFIPSYLLPQASIKINYRLTDNALLGSHNTAYNPMTALGARSIALFHTLFWVNPSNILYNECYFSSDSLLVANMDESVRVLNGYPTTVYDSVLVSSLYFNVKYFWRIVEYDSSGIAPSPIWYFTSVPQCVFLYEFEFNSGLDGWQIVGPAGYNNWYWSNTSNAGSQPGELVFNGDPAFNGVSYIMSPEIPVPVGEQIGLGFHYFEDYSSDTVNVGCAITTDNGVSWISIWELHATGDVGPEYLATGLGSAPGNFRLGFFYTGFSENIDFFYIDFIRFSTALTPVYPPYLLKALASSTEKKVILNWDTGGGPGPVAGYRLERKHGLPEDPNHYVVLVEVGASTHIFNDTTVVLNENYTYRISTLYGPYHSYYGNEATAYVPEYVPVELISFIAITENACVALYWVTATEINNKGFEIERSFDSDPWEVIGFVQGRGTTTEQTSYSFKDTGIDYGTYNYRLKQIDFDGSYEYSDVVSVTRGLPEEYALMQNYPNPFNPTTSITYEIAKTGTVCLKIYDFLGSETAVLVNEVKKPGRYTVQFNASDLSSGVYFYRISANGYVAAKKMIVVK